MKGMIHKCASCGGYTMRMDRCPKCGAAVRNPHPAKFSPEDKYSKYRLALKQEGKGGEGS